MTEEENLHESNTESIENVKQNNKKPFISVGISKKYFTFILIVVIIGCLLITKTPEYSIYKTAVSFKNNDYKTATKYVNIEKIVDNRVDAALSELNSDPKLANNPFSGFAYMVVDGIRGKLSTTIKDGFKRMVENPNNGWKEAQRYKIIYILIVKNAKVNDETWYMQKEYVNEKEVIFTISCTGISEKMTITLDKATTPYWKIVDIAPIEILIDAI